MAEAVGFGWPPSTPHAFLRRCCSLESKERERERDRERDESDKCSVARGETQRWPEQHSGSTTWLLSFAWWWWVAEVAGRREKKREQKCSAGKKKRVSRILSPN